MMHLSSLETFDVTSLAELDVTPTVRYEVDGEEYRYGYLSDGTKVSESVEDEEMPVFSHDEIPRDATVLDNNL